MSRVGLHIRIEDSLHAAALRAAAMQLPFFQCFLVKQGYPRLLEFDQRQIDAFLALRHNSFGPLYLHCSYWTNLADQSVHHYVFEKELALAHQLEFTHLVLHPGSIKGARNKLDALNSLAQALNKVIKKNPNLTVIIENTAHAGLSLGGDIGDLQLIKERIEKPEKIAFCIDTAHAYCYGYDLADQKGQTNFIARLESTIGIDSIALIHLNDSQEKCGSRIDKHAVPGQGYIGEQALKNFINCPQFKNKPIIMELPILTQAQEEAALVTVRSWADK